MTPPSASIQDAADALLCVIVKADRQRFALRFAAFRGRPIRDTDQPGATDEIDPTALVADPIGTACRAELRRIGHALQDANPREDFVALSVEVAEMDPTHADWRAMALKRHGTEVGRARV